MKFIFDDKQSYQLEAINAVADLFQGQPQDADVLRTILWRETDEQPRLDVDIVNEIGAVGNNLLLNEATILENLRHIQDRNGLEAAINLLDGLQFDVEMETGTGKTYVYLRTIFELAKRYSFRKFIILVPSVAIREGVNTSISLMREHFRSLYPEQPFDSFVYSGKTPEDVRSFATSTGVQIMIMTIDSIRGDSNNRIIHQQRDRLNGLKPIDFLKSVHPIVIMDEPQNMESLLSQSAVDELNPLCTLRYSATHRKTRNTVYRLDPVDAHELGLVKQIVVAETVQEGESSTPYIKLHGVKNKPTFQAQIELIAYAKDGSLKRTKKWVKPGVDLAELTRNEAYSGNWRIDEISIVPEYITLTNHNQPLYVGEEIGGASKDIYQEMIRETIREHLRKAAQVNKEGIKVLSLFFIDKVAHYLGDGSNNTDANGEFAMWFDKILDEERAKNSAWTETIPGEAQDLRSGYFAQTSTGRGTNKTVTFVDSSEKNNKKDDDAYELIMKDKARLLSMEEPVQFIFSHSALREGWDNPNVFQICTLREMNGETERRQTIGRGLRLPVNQSGERLSDRGLAQLTVVANESYSDFAKGLQAEYKKANVAIGYVNEGYFAKIMVDKDGIETALGFSGSQKIHQHLTKAGFIDEKGVVQPSFQPTIPGFSLQLPEPYGEIENEVINQMIKCTSELTKRKTKRVTRKLNKEIYLDPEFEHFWEKITARTTYRVSLNREEMIATTANAIKAAPEILPIRIRITRAGMKITRGGSKAYEQATRSTELASDYLLPDIVTHLQESTSLTRKTIIDILLRSGRLKDFLSNPNDFTTMVRNTIKTYLSSILVDGVQYEKIQGSIYELRELQADGKAEKDRFIDQLYKVKNTQKTDFDYVVYDSDVERKFAEYLDNQENIKLFLKLPDKFQIDTPVGPYNPDWAIVKNEDGEERLYMICETKGSLDPMKRRPSENAKINSAQKHFKAIGVEYTVRAPERLEV
ncbi:restriction endonuclease [Corynebacterium sp. sy017]|uniref:restriction endonuclease n=1 Tax=unclassified Corynebacterium TaxID=2624378 RepID=UPI001185374D|nr:MULTISPECIES: DEAD/DEAH box helicase family protein [unclassified Corynebacterium]MBP3088488.1 restriction endonuclease [Corynebacterium sp. sy017]TSD91793.1 restriction endonuclease [Corynebacterium sp. SY003]